MDYAKESLRLHEQWKGKIEVVSTVKTDTKDDLSLAYTPGVAQPCLEIQKDINKSYELTRRHNLCAVITDGTNKMYRLGHFFFVINPEFFMGLDTFKKTSGEILRGLRASEKAPGAERIYTAGEKEWLAWQERKDKGVPVGESIQQELIALRDEFRLDYKFPFEA